MTIPAAQADVAAFLRGLADGDPVETHISAVFLGQQTAWKLKKAVRLDFLDFTGIADRHLLLLRELVLNAASAPGLYRDVVMVRRGPDGSLRFGTAEDDASDAVDWVLRMARVPSGHFLEAIAEAGRLDDRLLDQVGDAVAIDHEQREIVDRDGMAILVKTVDGITRAARDAGLPFSAISAWAEAILPALSKLDAWQANRGLAGLVRRTHADLHLGNLCLWHGKPVPFDALEFDEDMASTDVAYDLAFLLMDLDQRVGGRVANRVFNRFVARTGDAGSAAAMAPFLSMRAMIRAHVQARRGAADAGAYMKAADAYLAPEPEPPIIAIGGLQGAGKTTLARSLAPSCGPAPGALVLRSDEQRKRLWRVAPETRLPATAYAPANQSRVNTILLAMLRAACSVRNASPAVILDATFLDIEFRQMVETTAAALGRRFLGIWLHADVRALEGRLEARRGDASDATVTVLRDAARADPGPGDWLPVPSADGIAALEAVRGEIARLTRWPTTCPAGA